MHPEIMAIGALGAVTAGAFGWFFSWYATLGGYGTLAIAIVFALLYIAFLTLRMLVTERSWHIWILTAADLILFALPFWGHWSVWFFAALGITNLWLFTAWRAGRKSTNNMIHIRLAELSHGFMKSSFRAVLFLGIASYLSLVDPSRIAISKELIAGSLSGVMNGANRGVIQQVVGRDITPEEAASVIEKVTVGIHTGIGAFVEKIPPQAQTGLLIGLGVIVFLLASSLINLFLPFVIGFVWCVLKLLLRLDFITITTEKTDKEIIVL
jgi:hypothetical protein